MKKINASRLQKVADTLEEGQAADVWYDADEFADEGSAKRIEITQSAMSEAAKLLRELADGSAVVETLATRVARV